MNSVGYHEHYDNEKKRFANISNVKLIKTQCFDEQVPVFFVLLAAPIRAHWHAYTPGVRWVAWFTATGEGYLKTNTKTQGPTQGPLIILTFSWAFSCGTQSSSVVDFAQLSWRWKCLHVKLGLESSSSLSKERKVKVHSVRVSEDFDCIRALQMLYEVEDVFKLWHLKDALSGFWWEMLNINKCLQ